MSKVDLSALRIEEQKPGRAPLGPRLAIVGLAIVVLGVAATFLVPLLRPARAVATAPVVGAGLAEGSHVMTAEAAGWIEPDPFPVVARPLVSGVLESLDVLEGDTVKKGDTVIGRLRSAELEAAFDRARARLALEEENLRHRLAELKVAEGLLEQKAKLRLDEAQARHELTFVAERLAAARGDLEAEKAERDARQAEYEGQVKLKEAGGSYAVALARAEAMLRAAEARVVKRQHELEAYEAERKQDEATLAIAKEVLDDPRELQGDVITARANVAHRTALRDTARVELEIARRELDWATVKAPMDGIVMKLHAAPGELVGPDAKALVAIYDPARLQARIDVPLASMEAVHVGQEVEVRSEVTGARRTKGTVLRVQRESDLLKNTLQVKVGLTDPDPLLRPETLCRARFLASRADTGAKKLELFRVPRAAVRDGAVFVLDPSRGRARRVPVERVGEEAGDVVVRAALSVTQRVILDEVEDDERVEVKP